MVLGFSTAIPPSKPPRNKVAAPYPHMAVGCHAPSIHSLVRFEYSLRHWDASSWQERRLPQQRMSGSVNVISPIKCAKSSQFRSQLCSDKLVYWIKFGGAYRGTDCEQSVWVSARILHQSSLCCAERLASYSQMRVLISPFPLTFV
jgi:hypothetical protein